MIKIIVADIFGRTPALITLGDSMNADVIVDPYNGEEMNFANEAQAYDYFIANIGLDNYQKKLLQVIEQHACECRLIGFSVGAAAIWKLSEFLPEYIAKFVKFATCYYGSQIRYFHKLRPSFDIALIFPRYEPHFDVVALQNTLNKKDKVTTTQVDYLHGFMNTYSVNFNRVGYKEHLALLQRL